MRQLEVRARWDAEAGVWWAESDDVPGLVTEAATFEQLVENVRALVPDLLELNQGIAKGGPDIPVHIVAERLERIHA